MILHNFIGFLVGVWGKVENKHKETMVYGWRTLQNQWFIVVVRYWMNLVVYDGSEVVLLVYYFFKWVFGVLSLILQNNCAVFCPSQELILSKSTSKSCMPQPLLLPFLISSSPPQPKKSSSTQQKWKLQTKNTQTTSQTKPKPKRKVNQTNSTNQNQTNPKPPKTHENHKNNPTSLQNTVATGSPDRSPHPRLSSGPDRWLPLSRSRPPPALGVEEEDTKATNGRFPQIVVIWVSYSNGWVFMVYLWCGFQNLINITRAWVWVKLKGLVIPIPSFRCIC